MIVLDSSALIELVGKTERGRKIHEILRSEAAALSAVSMNELLVTEDKRQKTLLIEVLDTMEVIAFDKTAGLRSVEVEEALRAAGTLIGKADIFIAATCLVHGLPLLTTDKDFEKVQGLQAIVV